MSRKKLEVWLPLLFAIVMMLGMAIGFKLKEKTTASGFFKNTNRTSLEEVVDLINSKYVDKVNADSIKNTVIEDILSQLDPHSVYIPASEMAEANEELKGSFGGIGVEFQVFNDTVNVINVVSNGPSYLAGVKVGDKIIAVNDTINIAGKKIEPDDIRKLLRGEDGSTVAITVKRNSGNKKIVITRGAIPLPSIDVAYMIAPETGFMRISKFSSTTYEEFMSNLEKLQKRGMKKLVLDLRGNGGGYLPEAVDIADELLDDNKMIVYTQGDKVEKEEFKAKREGLFEQGKVAVLVDETSASASEILAGALQDWDRATIVGRRTFGKGLVQQPFILSDNSGLRLTVARYYTPLGRNIQKPYSKGKDKYEQELISRFHNGELTVGDTAKPQGKAYKTPGGRTVYGGGGITPDIFVPFDTTSQPKEFIELFMKGTFSKFIYTYYIDNKAMFDQFKTPDIFEKQYEPGEKEWNALAALALKDSIDLSKVDIKGKQQMLKRTEALLARQIWRNEGYYEVNNLTDAVVQKALQALK